MANISGALRDDMSLFGLGDLFRGTNRTASRPRAIPINIDDSVSQTMTGTSTDYADLGRPLVPHNMVSSQLQGATQSFQIGGTGQRTIEDADMTTQDRANIVASVTVQDFMRQTLRVTDEPMKNRFLIHIGRLTFPVGYDQLCAETDKLLTADPTQHGSDSSEIFGSNMVMIAPQDKKKEIADEKAAALAVARAELAKPLQVKRAIIEKGYDPKA